MGSLRRVMRATSNDGPTARTLTGTLSAIALYAVAALPLPAHAQAPTSRLMENTSFGGPAGVTPAAGKAEGSVPVVKSYDRFSDTLLVSVAGVLGQAASKGGGFGGLLKRALAVNDGTTLTRYAVRGQTPTVQPRLIEFALSTPPRASAEQFGSASEAVMQLIWLLDGTSRVEGQGARSDSITSSNGSRYPTQSSRYATTMPTADFLRLADAKTVEARFGDFPFVVSESVLEGWRALAVELRTMSPVPAVTPNSVTGVPTEQDRAVRRTDSGRDGAPQSISPMGATSPSYGSSDGSSNATTRALLGVWADVETLGEYAYFRFEDGGRVSVFGNRFVRPAVAVCYGASGAAIDLLDCGRRASFTHGTAQRVGDNQIVVTFPADRYFFSGQPMTLRRLPLSEASRIEEQRARSAAQMQSLRNF